MRKIKLIATAIKLFYYGMLLFGVKSVLYKFINKNQLLSSPSVARLSRVYERFLFRWDANEKKFIHLMFRGKKEC